MSKSGGSPGDLSTAKQRGWLDQLRAVDFLVAAGSQPGLNQFASVVKEKCRIPVSHGEGRAQFLREAFHQPLRDASIVDLSRIRIP